MAIDKNHAAVAKQTDQPIAALLADLKQRGLLDETLVVWAGEFGRTPMVENNPALGRSRGRDHHPNAFTMWLAGGGIRSGQTIGQTDDLGYHAIEDPVHIHDLQATILHLLGVDQKSEVLVPSLNYIASANAVVQLGGSRHFIDVGLETIATTSPV